MDKAELRIFIAHQKGDSDADLIRYVKGITLALRRAFGHKEPKVTLGRDDYTRHFASAGSLDRWARDVVTRISPVTREPAYHGLVIPAGDDGAKVGAATKIMVEHALSIGKPVLIYGSDETLTKASRVVKVAERDFRTGWKVS
jgi:hypothetical protein